MHRSVKSEFIISTFPSQIYEPLRLFSSMRSSERGSSIEARISVCLGGSEFLARLGKRGTWNSRSRLGVSELAREAKRSSDGCTRGESASPAAPFSVYLVHRLFSQCLTSGRCSAAGHLPRASPRVRRLWRPARLPPIHSVD